ncbi:hypothetical protein BSL78_24980 [Apostichopus japonicus]|uniref:Cytosolic fatty-acid binding proteins domain-containing protein n=1 Tax=Stichopus japonicus TaxID=307972 RepID=A0A2G8JQY9_STIJA|nr:hypothetical protein BSL78_24980 [Apostichopus japonicus]
MAESLLGLYKLEKHENFEKFMEAIGVGLATRKIGANTTNTNEFTKDGEKFKLFRNPPSKTMRLNLNSEKNLRHPLLMAEKSSYTDVEQCNTYGRISYVAVSTVSSYLKCRTVFTWENGKLIQKEWPLKDKAAGEAVYERELKGDLLITGFSDLRSGGRNDTSAPPHFSLGGLAPPQPPGSYALGSTIS